MSDCPVILGYLPDGRTPIHCQATLVGHESHWAKVRKDAPVSVADRNVARTPPPEGLCNYEETASTLDGMNQVIETHSITGTCTFTPHPEGTKHSWE